MLLTPPVLIISSFISFKSITDHSKVDYHKKFGSFFSEFKNNRGFWSTQYYSLFFLRRLTYLVAQVYLNNAPYVQVGVNIGFSAVQLLYLFYYLPFKEIHIQVSVISGEIASAVFITGSVFYLGSVSANVSGIVEATMIYSVIGSMGVQFLVSIYSMILSLKVMWKKIIKYRALSFIKVSSNAGRTLSEAN